MTVARGRTNNKKTTTARGKRDPVRSNGAPQHAGPTQHAGPAPSAPRTGSPLQQSVAASLVEYFDVLDGEATQGLYDLVMGEVERPLLEAVMARVDGNQSRAASILGMNRGTLRKKLNQHGLLDG